MGFALIVGGDALSYVFTENTAAFSYRPAPSATMAFASIGCGLTALGSYALVLASQWFGKKTVIERMMSAQIALPATVWRRLNLSWGLFFVVLGAANIYVAFYYGLDLDPEVRRGIWVNFKVFGLLGLTLLFTVIQAFLMAKHIQEKPASGDPVADRTAD